MTGTLEIIQDGETILCFERSPTMPALQRRQLEELDLRLGQGVELDDEHIAAPDRQQCVRFVIGLLLRALRRADEPTVRGLCTWLSHRQPELAAIRVCNRDGGLDVELDYGADEASDV